MSPYITPSSKARRHDVRGSPGGHQIHSSERDGVEDGRVYMVHCTGVFVVELCYLRLCMYLCMHLPLVVTLVITFPLNQVLQSVVTHAAVQDSLDLILFLTVDESWEWGWCRSSARDRIRRRGGQLDHGGDGVKVAKVGGQSETVCTIADTGFKDKGASASVRQLRRQSVGGDVASIQPDFVSWCKYWGRLALAVVVHGVLIFCLCKFASSISSAMCSANSLTNSKLEQGC
jgi:hypothetical protein